MKQHRSELWSKWRGLVSEQGRSGQTVAAFCRERGLRDWLFYDWTKRLREGEVAEFVEVKVKEPCEEARLASAHSPAIEVRLTKGRTLFVEPGFDVSHLRALLAVLETEA